MLEGVVVILELERSVICVICVIGLGPDEAVGAVHRLLDPFT